MSEQLNIQFKEEMDIEQWLRSHNIVGIAPLLTKLNRLKRLDSRMDCVDEILSLLSTHNVKYSEREDEIKDLAID